MRRLLLFCVLACLAGALFLGYALVTPAAPRAAPTPTADPLIWSGCTSCDVQQRRVQATAATP